MTPCLPSPLECGSVHHEVGLLSTLSASAWCLADFKTLRVTLFLRTTSISRSILQNSSFGKTHSRLSMIVFRALS